MQALYAQLLVGLINGSFYALLSLGLAVIFGMLNIINFAHGALYMMGAFVAYFLLNIFGIGYWPALIIAPIVVGISGMILERTMLQWLAGADQPGQAADGRKCHHRGVRGGGDRRHGFDHGIDHHGLYARRGRGIDEILLSRGFQHRGFCPDGAGAAGEAYGTDGTGGLT